MRVNVYAEEMTDHVEIISKTIGGQEFTGLRIYLHLPVTRLNTDGSVEQVQGPFMHNPMDDDSSAVTFWGKRDLRTVLAKATEALDRHYAERDAEREERRAYEENVAQPMELLHRDNDPDYVPE